MTTLSRQFRKSLENTVLAARDIAEKGAAEAIVSFGVGDPKAPMHLDDQGKLLRRKLRAHGRQVGDKLLDKDVQGTDHLAQECAYEHWHRMLFARFLAENDLLRHPDHGVPLSLNECQDLAREQGLEIWELAGQFAQKMLPEIFRTDDPVLMLRLPAEARNKLLKILNGIPRDVFLADDSLGWVYQFWQTKKKQEVNDSGKKIGADEIAAVTQLFTEDYMVEFLLHNTLGAWWVAKRLNEGKIDQKAWASCQTEDECRKAVKLGRIEWKYLRFIKKDDGQWFPATGGFEGWPKLAKELKILDPCMGSGHFLVFALPILMAFRQEEEGLSEQYSCAAVLRENLFGLEIDLRCAQIAAFNLALSAWKLGKYQILPSLNLACSGLAPHTSKAAWLKLVGGNENLKFSMGGLYELFSKAPYLGSLINPRQDKSVTFTASFKELLPYLEKAVALEADEEGHELAVSAKGMAKAAEILAGQFTMVATNVPYLGRGKQDDVLKDYCEEVHSEAKADLATCFIERCLNFSLSDGSIALVAPQNWLFQTGFRKLRVRLLNEFKWSCVAKLGTRAFQGITGEVVTVALDVLCKSQPAIDYDLCGLDVSLSATPDSKANSLASTLPMMVKQKAQHNNPEARIAFDVRNAKVAQLGDYCECYQGVVTGDISRWVLKFWEVGNIDLRIWSACRAPSDGSSPFDGEHDILRWEQGNGQLHEYAAQTRYQLHDMHESGNLAWGRKGVVINRVQSLRAGIYCGEIYHNSIAAVVPKDPALIGKVWAFCNSPSFEEEVRRLSPALGVTNKVLIQIPFDPDEWSGDPPKPFSSDPTQWLFCGHPKGSDHPLHVAVARLLGYRWPRQTGSSFPDCPALGEDGLEKFADNDGIVCLTSLRGEPAAADRLRELLSAAYGPEWTSRKEKELIVATGSNANNFEEWLRDDFFTQHCAIFHQRPFIWHIWDGRKDGFNALVNYHRLADGAGNGRRTLESLTYSYLGDWITRQRDAVKRNEAGAEGRLAAALELQEELKEILAGEPPYDIFVRWKPLSQQAIGWEPDINDGVRINIRPFMMANLSKGKKGAGNFRDKPKIKWDKDRGGEPVRDKKDFPWFWSWDESSIDFMGGKDFDGNRWNSCYYSNEVKRKARGK